MVSGPDKIEDFENLDDGNLDEGMKENPDGESGIESVRREELELEETPALEDAVEDGNDLEPLVDEAPDMMFSKEARETHEEEVMVKYCLFCREVIPAEAIACKHCGHVVHIFEGKVFKQLYWFFWGGLITFVGCFLPYYSGDMALVTACTTLSGALYLIFSLLVLAGMGMSIYAKRLIISPIFLMFPPAIHTWWTVVERVAAAPNYKWFEFLYNFEAIGWLGKDAGAGLLLIMFGSTIAVLTFISSLFSAVFGGGKDKEEKTAKRENRGRGRRR
jgi:hypothetical protein